METVDKIKQIFDIIKDIQSDDPNTAAILMDGLGLSLNILTEIAENGGKPSRDISEHMEVMSRIFGFSVEDLFKHILDKTADTTANKTPDQDTLDFITSDLDDYEKFLAQNKAKENLAFLADTI